MEFFNYSDMWAKIIIDQVIKTGVYDFFTCPGMRNAPLLRAITTFSKSDQRIRIFSGIDERAQSYRALAYMKATQRPVVLTCTSGTAVANFLPAVIEANKTNLPLIVLSADRPGELNAIDANQTINQVEVLRNYCKNFWMTSEPQESYPLEALTGKINFLLHDSLKNPKGPLHINCPFRDPLDSKREELPKEKILNAEAILKKTTPHLTFKNPDVGQYSQEVSDLSKKVLEAKNPLIVFGPLFNLENYDKETIKDFIKSNGGNFSCDITTGLKYHFGAQDGLIPTLDHPEVLKVLEQNPPDLIVHFGHRIVSKHYYNLLPKLKMACADTSFILINEGNAHEDPGLQFNERWNLPPNKVIRDLVIGLKSMAPIKRERASFQWEELIEKKRAIIEEHQLTYPYITKRAVDTLSNIKAAFIGNSTFIRSMDSFASTTGNQDFWNILANRGASGIEGHVAMTLGLCEASDQAWPTLALMGDLSFLYDLNSLVQLKSFYDLNPNYPLLMIIANNKGGGIFKLLPIGKSEEDKESLPLLTTPQELNLSSIVKGFEIPAQKVTTKEDYQSVLEEWKLNPHFLILEVEFLDEDNCKVYDKLKTIKL